MRSVPPLAEIWSRSQRVETRSARALAGEVPSERPRLVVAGDPGTVESRQLLESCPECSPEQIASPRKMTPSRLPHD